MITQITVRDHTDHYDRFGGGMSERLRKVYEKREEARIAAIVELKHGEHNKRMRHAGEKFKLAHPEWYPVK